MPRLVCRDSDLADFHPFRMLMPILLAHGAAAVANRPG